MGGWEKAMRDDYPTYRVGDVTITKVEELVLEEIPFSFLYPSAEAKDLEAVKPQLDGGALGKADASVRLSVHTWVVRTPDHLILVDTGCGNDKERPQNPMFHRLSMP